MKHQIQKLICQCNDGKYRLKTNCTKFEGNWYKTTELEETTTIYKGERYWLEECRYSDYLDQHIPEDFFYDNHYYCENCDSYYHESEKTEHIYNSTSFCDDCFYESFTYCHTCDTAITSDDTYRSEFTLNDYCESCYYDLHSHCENCEADYWIDDGCSCGSIIHNYSYKPEPHEKLQMESEFPKLRTSNNLGEEHAKKEKLHRGTKVQNSERIFGEQCPDQRTMRKV